MIVAMMAICIAWLKCLQNCAWYTLVTPYVIQCSAGMAMAIVCFSEGGGGTGFLIMVVVAGVIGWLYYNRENLNKSSEMCEVAVTTLFNNPGMMLLVFAWLFAQVILIVIVVLTAIFMGGVAEVQQVDNGLRPTCMIEIKSWANNMFTLFIIIFFWIFYTMRAVQTFFISGIVGSEVFGQREDDRPHPLGLLKLAITRNIGTNAFSGAVMAIVDYIHTYLVDRGCMGWLCDVLTGAVIYKIPLLILYCCFRTCIDMLTKMTTIFHVYTGLAFFESASNTLTLMQSKFGLAMVLNLTVKNLFSFIGYLLSVALAVCTWLWLGEMYGANILANPNTIDGGMGTVLGILMLVLMILLLSSPYMSIFLVVIIAMFVGKDVNWLWIPWLCAMFMGGIAAIFFETCGETVLVASDSVFVAMSMQEECMSAEEFEQHTNANELLKHMNAIAVTTVAEADQGSTTTGQAPPPTTAPTTVPSMQVNVQPPGVSLDHNDKPIKD